MSNIWSVKYQMYKMQKHITCRMSTVTKCQKCQRSIVKCYMSKVKNVKHVKCQMSNVKCPACMLKQSNANESMPWNIQLIRSNIFNSSDSNYLSNLRLNSMPSLRINHSSNWKQVQRFNNTSIWNTFKDSTIPVE